MRQVDLLGNDGAPCARFILIDPQEKDDGVRKVKSCKAYSLEYEFAKKDFFLEEGTYNFYNPLSQENTILDRIFEVMPDWSINSISPTLPGRYRTFDEQKCKAYDFIKNQVQEKYGCIFEFDTVNRTIDIIDVTEDRSATDKRRVFLSPERLIKEIDINEDSDKIVTALDVSGADGVTIRSVNPTGTNTIYNLDYFMNETNFPGGNEADGIITKWNEWKADVAAAQSDYYDITIQYNMKLLQVMMKQAELDELNIDLLVLENEQAVIIQGIQQKLKKQSDLTNVNTRITAKKAEIAAKQAEVDAMQASADALHADLIDINEDLALDTRFTAAEMTAIRRYFLEDSIQDGTFVAETAKTYVNEDAHSAVTNQALSITGSAIADPATRGDHTVYTCKGGQLVFSDFRGYVVSATIDDDANGDTVLTAYLRSGTIGLGLDAAVFESATITVAGTAGAITASDTALSFTVTSGDFYFTENTTEYELHQIEYELYEYGSLVLQRKCNPTYNFTVNSGNFLIIDDFVSFKNQLELGRKVYLQLEENTTPLQPYVLSVTMDYEDFGSFTIKFSDSYTSFDNSFDLADLLSQSVSMGKTLSTKGNSYELFVASGASTKVHDFMTSALDIATNSVMSTGMQAITMDDSGLRIRKWTDSSHEAYDPHQIWIVDNVMAFTKDGWNTSEMALGEIFDENLLSYIPTEDLSQVQGKTYYTDDQGTVWDGTTPWSTSLYERSYGYTITTDMSRDTSKTYYVRDEETGTFSVWNPSGSIPWSQNLYEKSLGATAYGICAPYIVGTMIAGNNLVIESEKKDGGTSVFRVDGNGASLYNANFKVKNGTSEIVIDPELGFGIGKATASQSIISNGAWDTTKTTLWIDNDGNAHFKGKLEAATGAFNGKLQVGKIGSSSNYHFNVDEDGYLTILNDNGNVQLSADSSGNLTFNGSYSGTLDVGPYTYGGDTYYHFKVESTGRLSIGTSYSTGSVARQERFVVTNAGYLTLKDGAGNSMLVVNSSGATFYGALSGVTGTFKGSLSAGVEITSPKISGGTIKAGTLSSNSDTNRITLEGFLDVGSYGYLGGFTGSAQTFQTTGVGMYSSAGVVAATSGGAALKTSAGEVFADSQGAGFRVVGNATHTVLLRLLTSSIAFRPSIDSDISLGTSDLRWGVIYSMSGTINTSDRQAKHDISYDIDDYEYLFDELKPVKYKFNNGTSNRYHTGFISQDIEESLDRLGMSTLDFAGFIKSPRYDEEGHQIEGYNYALRYEEFIALNALKIKKLEQRIVALEAQLAQ